MNIVWLLWNLWSISFANPIEESWKSTDVFLVIVSSSKEKNDAQHIYSKVSEIEGLTPVRLNSGHFKGLMPCWEIIAIPAQDGKAAKAVAKTLNRNNVTNYIKRPGVYVGANERLDAMCSTPNTTAGPNNSRFGLKLDTGPSVYMPLMLKSEIREAVLQQQYTEKSTDNTYETWIGELNNQTIESFSKGQTWEAYDIGTAQKQECSIVGFVAMTRGTPHFGIVEQGEKLTESACGSPFVYAKFDCPEVSSGTLEQRFVFYPNGQGTPFKIVDYKAWQDVSFSPKENQDTSIQLILDEAEVWGKEQNMPVETTMRMTGLLDKGSSLKVVEFSIFTGTGNNECGGDDFNTTASAIYRDGVRITEFVESRYTPVLGIIEQKSGVVNILKKMDYSDLIMHDSKGGILTSLPKDFCDCGC